MIKKLLFISLIMCEVICFSGCDNGATEPVAGTVDRQSADTGTKEETTSREIDTEQTGEPTSELITEPTSQPVTEPTSDPDTEKPSVSNEDIFEKFDNYSIKKLYLTMSSSVGLNVRKGPSEDYERVDGIAREQIVNVIGQCVETGWYMIKVNGTAGFVSNQFLTINEDSNNLVLGDECPYQMYSKTEYEGQMGWFYRTDLGWQPSQYKQIVESLVKEGYTTENFPVYVGTWRDVGDVMWFGYSKQ